MYNLWWLKNKIVLLRGILEPWNQHK